jgi:hypothetical protein
MRLEALVRMEVGMYAFVETAVDPVSGGQLGAQNRIGSPAMSHATAIVPEASGTIQSNRIAFSPNSSTFARLGSSSGARRHASLPRCSVSRESVCP